MKNTLKEGQITFLITPHSTWGYLGMCKELGLIETGASLDVVENRLLKGAVLILDTVEKNPQYESMLNAGLPFKYKILFHTTLIRAYTHSLRNFSLFSRETSQLVPRHA